MPQGALHRLAAGLLLLLASNGHAATVQPQSIRLTLAASPAAAAKVEAVLRDSFARRNWALETFTVAAIDPRAIAAPEAGQPTSSVWLDLAAPRKALYLVDEAHGLIHTRELDVGDEPDSVGLELIRFVVESSLDAMQAGEIQGVPRAEFERRLALPTPPSGTPAPPPTTTPVPPSPGAAPTAPPAARMALAGGYHAQLVGDGAIGHGLFVSGRWHPFRVGLDGSLRTQWPVHLTAGDLDMRLWSSSLRLHAALPLPLAHRTLLVLGLGGGWEVTRVAPAGAGAVATFWASAPLLSAFAAVEHSVGRLFVSVRFDLDADLIEVRYQARRADATTTDWRPHRFRPAAAALAGFRY